MPTKKHLKSKCLHREVLRSKEIRWCSWAVKSIRPTRMTDSSSVNSSLIFRGLRKYWLLSCWKWRRETTVLTRSKRQWSWNLRTSASTTGNDTSVRSRIWFCKLWLSLLSQASRFAAERMTKTMWREWCKTLRRSTTSSCRRRLVGTNTTARSLLWKIASLRRSRMRTAVVSSCTRRTNVSFARTCWRAVSNSPSKNAFHLLEIPCSPPKEKNFEQITSI